MWILYICFLLISLLVVYLYRYSFSSGNPIDADKKGVVITGAASGIGLALTEELLLNDRYKGVHVYATDVNQRFIDEKLVPLQESLKQNKSPSKLTILKMNVMDEDSVKQTRETIQENGDFFAIVNNAGVATGYPRKDSSSDKMIFQGIDELKSTEVYHIWDINVFGVLRVTHEFMKILPPQGAVVSIASIAGLFSGPYFGYYAMTKHAVLSFMDSLRREHLGFPFRFVTICPGFVKTPLLSMLDNLSFDPQHSRHAHEASVRVLRNRENLHQHSQSPQRVASIIAADAIFRERPVPVILIDYPVRRVIYRILSTVPSRIADKLIQIL